MSFTLYQLGLILYATLVTFVRIWLVILVSIIVSIFLGILSARVRAAELIIIPIVDVLESVPVVSFFPLILVLLISHNAGSLGEELAVDLLITSAVIWNLILAVYESVAMIPKDYIEVSDVFHLTLWQRIRKIFVPASYPRIMTNLSASFASALFYITFSEMMMVQGRNYSVFGIATLARQYAEQGEFLNLIVLFAVLIISIYLVFQFLINPLVEGSERYRFEVVGEAGGKRKQRVAVGLVAESIAARASQIADSGRRMVGRVSSLISLSTERKPTRRKLSLTQRQANIVVGTVLLVTSALAFYVIAESGFYLAFVSVFLTYGFLQHATIGFLYDAARIGIVYGVTLLTMVPLAIYLGMKSTRGRSALPFMQIMYSFPSPLFLPALLVLLVPRLTSLFGLYSSVDFIVLIITYLSAGQYIFFNTYGAMLALPSDMKMTVESFSFSRWKKLRYLILPSLFPALVTGSMVTLGSYWGGLAVSEYTVVGNTVYHVGNGLMLYLDQEISSVTGNIHVAEAIDIYLVIIIILISFLVWIRLYSFAKRRYSYDI